MIRFRSVLVLVTGAAALLQATPTSGQVRPRAADVRILAESDSVHAGDDLKVGVAVTLADGLHVQSNAPRDPAFIPTVVTVSPPSGVTVEEIVFPVASDLRQQGSTQPLAVFEHQFTIGVRLNVAASATPGELIIPGRLRYQTCDEAMCYAPTTTPVSWTVRVVPSVTPITRDVNVELDRVHFGTAHGEWEEGARAAEPVERTASAEDPLAALAGFDVAATTGGYLDSGEFIGFLHNAEAGVREVGWFDGRGPLAIVLLVVLGGLALNLTPCVLPMIPINLAIIGAGSQAGSRRRGLFLGAAYGAAMAAVYGVLGLIVILTAGTFGTLNASPWFNVGIAALFIVLGLAMFDMVTIDLSKLSSRFSASQSKGTFVLAFSMGAVAALLAGACVAPVVIQVVLFSTSLYASGHTVALALPFLLGLGMALPWPIAGAGIAALPRPGAWMTRVKHGFGVVILSTAAYYGYVAYGLLADRWVNADQVTASVEAKVNSGWHASMSEGLAAATRERKPVLVDLWATWCKNCLTMDETTFEDPAVIAALSGYVKVKFQAEQPDEEPARSVMDRFHAIGLPTYVVLRPVTASEPAK
ncbi:MAG: thioredoxin family protein [Acidobacteria bacterium]|nr:thioredoxin family protein [Acidobacteriota bacterium]